MQQRIARKHETLKPVLGPRLYVLALNSVLSKYDMKDPQTDN